MCWVDRGSTDHGVEDIVGTIGDAQPSDITKEPLERSVNRVTLRAEQLDGGVYRVEGDVSC